jgi:hypothetical protein
MDAMVEILGMFQKLVWKIIEIGFALIVVLVILYALLGEKSGDFTVSVITNLSLMISALPPESLASVIVLVLAYQYIKKEK